MPLQIGQQKQVRVLQTIQIGLLRRPPQFRLTSTSVRATRWHNATHDEENVPQQKRSEFEEITAHILAVAVAVAATVVVAATATFFIRNSSVVVVVVAAVTDSEIDTDTASGFVVFVVVVVVVVAIVLLQQDSIVRCRIIFFSKGLPP